MWVRMLRGGMRAAPVTLLLAHEVVDKWRHLAGPPNAIPLAHLHASFHEEILSYGADAVALLQTDAVAAAAACALDASSEAGAAAMQRALGAGGTGSGRAVVSGSTYGVMHRRLLRDAKGDSATADDEEAPPSPRQGIMRFFA